MMQCYKVTSTCYVWVVGDTTGLTVKENDKWHTLDNHYKIDKTFDTLGQTAEFINKYFDLPNKKEQY